MGTVRGNMGTVLEHVLLSEAVYWATESERRPTGSLLYVDTHTMAPLNRPVGNDFNLLERLRKAGCRLTETGAAIWSEVFLSDWLPETLHWYPTHFVHATRVANRAGCAVDALLFETDSAEARVSGQLSENRRAEIATFLDSLSMQKRVGLSSLTATLSDPGNFRTSSGWPCVNATEGSGDDATTPAPPPERTVVVMSDPLEYRPEAAPGGSNIGPDDLKALRTHIDNMLLTPPELLLHVMFASGNLGTWGGRPDYATGHLSNAWRRQFALPGGETWCGACYWGGFLVFLGVSRRRDGSTLARDCETIRERTLDALPRIHVSRAGDRGSWIGG